jgi:hypothetical protein
MTDRSKFEEMLEKLVNEDRSGAEELFHEIVVEKSRDIYESLLEDEEEVDEASDEDLDESDDDDLDEASDEDLDESDDELDESKDEEVEEASDEDLDESDDDDLDEMFGLDEMDPEMGGDPTDDMMGQIADMGDDAEGGEEEPEGDVEDRVMDLEDAIEELQKQFDDMMAGDEGDDEEGDDEEGGMDMDMGGDDEEPEEEAFTYESKDEEVEEATDEEVDESSDEDLDETKTIPETMREYVEKINATMGDNGVNNKSTVAGKNDMGGTTTNTVRADTSSDPEVGAGKKVAGNALNDQNPKEDNAGNRNTPGGMSAKKGMKNEPGHGAEKKGKPETADKGAGSMLNGAPKRAK